MTFEAVQPRYPIHPRIGRGLDYLEEVSDEDGSALVFNARRAHYNDLRALMPTLRDRHEVCVKVFYRQMTNQQDPPEGNLPEDQPGFRVEFLQINPEEADLSEAERALHPDHPEDLLRPGEANDQCLLYGMSREEIEHFLKCFLPESEANGIHSIERLYEGDAVPIPGGY